MKFRKKPVAIEAITFEELVAHGVASGGNIVNGMPWSFQYAGHGISHENDNCYLIPTLEGTMRMDRGDMLITGVKGENYPCKPDIFALTYEPAADETDPGLNISSYDLKTGAVSVEALQGFTTGYAIDPLESAIESTSRLMRDERDRLIDLPLTGTTAEFQTATLHRLADHLDELLALQIKHLSAVNEVA